jgi:hypothetical protein
MECIETTCKFCHFTGCHTATVRDHFDVFLDPSPRPCRTHRGRVSDNPRQNRTKHLEGTIGNCFLQLQQPTLTHHISADVTQGGTKGKYTRSKNTICTEWLALRIGPVLGSSLGQESDDAECFCIYLVNSCKYRDSRLPEVRPRPLPCKKKEKILTKLVLQKHVQYLT